jgi:hypothetical protein
MRARFHAEPIIQATELLLQERTPRDVEAPRPRAEEVKAAANVRELVPPMPRRFRSPHQSIPRTHLLSNGSYAVMITAAGSRLLGHFCVTRIAAKSGQRATNRAARSRIVTRPHSSRTAPKSPDATARSRPR